MYKTQTVRLSLILGMLLLLSSVASADTPPIPGVPHRFYGTAKDTNGNSLPNNTIVQAVVDGENYTTTVVNGTYGYYTPFYVEDPNNDNVGKTIHFFVDGIDTGQTVVFNPGSIQLNLTVNEEIPPEHHGDGTTVPPSNNGNIEIEKKPPVAIINVFFYGFVNKTMIFNASESYDPDGNITSYSWNFGDGSMGSGVVVSHIYNDYGVYTVTLKVTDNNSLFGINETTIHIMFDSDNDSWGNDEEITYGTDPNNSTDYPPDMDNDHIPDSVDTDIDNDGLTNDVESRMGTNSTIPTYNILIHIGDTVDYLVDINNDHIPDIFYNTTSNIFTSLNVTADGMYLIDDDSDGVVEYIYNPNNGVLSSYQENTTANDNTLIFGLIVLLGLIICIGFIVLILRKKVKK